MSPKTSKSSKRGSGGGTGARSLLTPGRIAVIVLGVFALVFIFGNTRTTKIRVLIPEVTMPLWMALLGTAAIGALCGAYFMQRRR
ncbi:LapA family protein [Streptomyces sp. NPDC050704]|uniref:LapA family protein n=1 Tax=Streptomyces sp. NPDC050704 TaxID=3157219 RepID=UPI003440BA1E